jgi:putative glycosyltransferase (TIGR04372 family)
MEMLMALDDARRTGLPLYLLTERQTVNPSLYQIEVDGVTMAEPGLAVRLWLHLVWQAGRMPEWLRYLRYEAFDYVRAGMRRRLRRAARLEAAKSVRRPLRRLADRLADADLRPRGDWPYMRRRAMRQPLRTRLSADAAARAERAARELGIAPDAPLVIVHAREPGFKRGREVHEKPRRSGDDERPGKLAREDKPGKRRNDELRNGRIETYFPAIDRLVAQGYTVVRVGDASMTPVHHEGVIDVATHPRRVPELDLYLLFRSTFAVVGESGPGQAALLTNTPTLTLNGTDPISAFPVRHDGLFVLKRVREIRTGRVLSLREMFGLEYLSHIRDPVVFEYIDNTPEEIIDAVEEIQAIASGLPLAESATQAAYKELALRTAEEFHDRTPFLRKFGAHEGFLGDGRIGRTFVERYW